MDYRIRRGEEVSGGGYIEIGSGSWANYYGGGGYDSIFITDDSFFAMASGIVARYLPDFNPFGPNYIPRETGQKIIGDWQSIAERFSTMSVQEVQEQLDVPSGYYPELESEISEHGPEISFMLKRLARVFEKFYQMDDLVYVLGI